MKSIIKLLLPFVFYWFNTYDNKFAALKLSRQFGTNILPLEGTRTGLTGPNLCGDGHFVF